MKTFEDKIKKLEQLQNAGMNYVWKLKTPRLTEGFWDNYGRKMDTIIYDLKQNHFDEYKKYCGGHINHVDDLMCW